MHLLCQFRAFSGFYTNFEDPSLLFAPIQDSSYPLYHIGTHFLFLFFFCFLGPHLQHMEVPRLGVESELQLPAYTTATAMQDPRRLCYLHHSSRQCQVLNPPSEAKDRTCVLMDASQLTTEPRGELWDPFLNSSHQKGYFSQITSYLNF